MTRGIWYKMIDIKDREWNRTNIKNYNPWKIPFKKFETKYWKIHYVFWKIDPK